MCETDIWLCWVDGLLISVSWSQAGIDPFLAFRCSCYILYLLYNKDMIHLKSHC